MTGDPRIESYEWAGGREAMLRFGPKGGPVVVAALPLFEEANRTRALIVNVLRDLSSRGIGGALPDIPGQGESSLATVGARLPDWRCAFAAAASQVGHRSYVFAVRGGALIDGEAKAIARVHLAPERGASLVRNLLRARRAAAIADGVRPLPDDDPDQVGPPLQLAGNIVDRSLLRELMSAEPSQADRVLALFPAIGGADRLLAPNRTPNRDGDLPRFRKPWTSSEPIADPELVKVLVDDIVSWIAACGG